MRIYRINVLFKYFGGPKAMLPPLRLLRGVMAPVAPWIRQWPGLHNGHADHRWNLVSYVDGLLAADSN